MLSTVYFLLLRYCFEEDYEAGEVIFSPGDEGDSFYVVTAGQVITAVQYSFFLVNCTKLRNATHDTNAIAKYRGWHYTVNLERKVCSVVAECANFGEDVPRPLSEALHIYMMGRNETN